MRSPDDYFERDEDGIRLKGPRMWLEDILDLYLQGLSPEHIVDEHHFPTLSREEVEAAIAYYKAHRTEVDTYLAQQRAEAAVREEHAAATTQAQRLRSLLEERRRNRAPST